MNNDWWKDFVISVPRPISPGMMVGMRDEQRNGHLYVVEFLEPVPAYQPNPFAMRQQCKQEPDERVVVAWSQGKFTILNGEML